MGKLWRPQFHLYTLMAWGESFQLFILQESSTWWKKETLAKLMILDKTGLSGDFEFDTEILQKEVLG